MQWDLSTLFKDHTAFEEAFASLKSHVTTVASFKGKLSTYESFKDYYYLQNDVMVLLYKVYQYAQLKSHLNLKDVQAASKVQEVMYVLNQFQQASSFASPEILAAGEETIMGFIEKDPLLKTYRFNMQKLFHQNEHVLDANSESLLSHFNPLTSAGQKLHSALSVADNGPKSVTLTSGETVDITPGNYRSYLADLKDPKDREAVFKTFFAHYAEHKHAYAEIYNTVLQADVARMKARNYTSSVESYLFGNNIDPKVFHNILAVARENTAPLKRYYELRKQILGLDKHHTYDRFMPLAQAKSKFTYDEAKQLFFDSIQHLDEDFQAKAKEALAEGYVDVYEQDGKITGAYSWGALNEHPFILMNYDDTLNSVFTLVHEAGHAMHSLWAHEHQPVATQNYTIFVAEIASTFNEHVLLDHIIAHNTGSKEDKIALLQQSIDDIMATFYRQVLFANYELEAHALAEAGKPITHESLSQIMIDLYQHYYDIDIAQEPGKSYVWAYIPHLFNTPFYVYQYATSFAASLKLYEMVKEDPKNIALHKQLLASGGSDWPVEQVRQAGIDLTQKEAFEAVVNRLHTLLDALELAIQS